MTKPAPIRDWLLALFIFLVILEGLSWEMASWPFPCVINAQHDEKPTNNDDPKYCPTFYAGIKILVARTDHFIEAHDKSIVAGFTVVLAISTIGLWLATARLWEAGERQLKLIESNAAEQSRNTKASIKVAQDAAKAAQRSADIAERSLILSDRAWIRIQVEVVDELVFDGDTITVGVKIVIKNVGKSPATHVGYHLDLCADVLDAANKGRGWEDAYQMRRPGLIAGSDRTLFPDGQIQVDRMYLSMKRDEFLRRIAEQDASDTEAGEIPSGTNYPTVVVVAPYGLPSAGIPGRYRYTTFVGEIRVRGAPFGAYFTGNESGFAPEELEVVEAFLGGRIT